MKRTVAAGFFACSLLVAAGCGNSTVDSQHAPKAQAAERKAVPVQKAGKLDQIKKKALYTIQMSHHKKTYDIYVYSEHAQKTEIREGSNCAHPGDQAYQGEFALAAVQKGSKEPSILNIGKQTFQVPVDAVDVVEGTPDLLMISHCVSAEENRAALFMFDQQGKLVQVKGEDGKKLTLNTRPDRIKARGKGTYQSAVFSNAAETNWLFYNWKLDTKKATLKLEKEIIPKNPEKVDLSKWTIEPDYIIK